MPIHQKLQILSFILVFLLFLRRPSLHEFVEFLDVEALFFEAVELAEDFLHEGQGLGGLLVLLQEFGVQGFAAFEAVFGVGWVVGLAEGAVPDLEHLFFVGVGFRPFPCFLELLFLDAVVVEVDVVGGHGAFAAPTELDAHLGLVHELRPVSGRGVAEKVGPDLFLDAGFQGDAFEDLADAVTGEGRAFFS